MSQPKEHASVQMAWSKIDDGSEGTRHHSKHVRKDARPCSSLQRTNKSGTSRGTCCMCWAFQPALDVESAHGHAGKVRLGSPQVAVAVLCPRKSSAAPATSRDQGVATRTRLSSQPRVCERRLFWFGLPASCGVVLPFVFLAKRALSSRWRCIRLLTYVPPYRTLSS